MIRVDAMITELRQSLRDIGRSPGFAMTVVVTMALAIGATTTAVSLLNAVALRSLPVTRARELVSIAATNVQTNRPTAISANSVAAYREGQRSLSSMSMYATGLVRVEAGGVAADAVFEAVESAYFDVVGSRPQFGRLFTAEDEHRSVLAISERFRRRLFGNGVPLGTVVRLEGMPAEIVGVTNAEFAGLQIDSGADVFVPIRFVAAFTGGVSVPLRTTNIVGRLRPSVTVAQANAELVERWAAIERAMPTSGANSAPQALRVQLESLATGYSGFRQQYETALIVLTAVGILLVVAAAVNLATLLLARSLRRSHQMAVRIALGASRKRIIIGVLIESVVLALAGLVLALPFVWWTVELLTDTMSIARATPVLPHFLPDTRVLLAATVVAAGIGVLMGLVPAWRGLRGRVALQTLHGGRTLAQTLGRLGQLLLVSQLVVSTTLVVGAGLFTATLARLRANDTSSRTHRVLWARLAPTPGDRQPVRPEYLATLVAHLRDLPGVDSASLSAYYPAVIGFPGQLPTDRYLTGEQNGSGAVAALTEFVSPGFFDLFEIRRLHGRDFGWLDTTDTAEVAILPKRVARRLFGESNAVGRVVQLSASGRTRDLEVVGVVADTSVGRLRDPEQPVVFRPITQEPSQGRFPLAHVRVAREVESTREPFTRAVAALGRHFVRRVFSVDEWLDHALLQERITAALATFAALFGLALTCIGVYASLAYSVAARVREIGVRVALGATRGSVIGTVVREAVMVTLVGIALGIPCSIGAARIIRSQLYGVSPLEPGPIVVAALLFLVTGIIASAGPAARAARIDPMRALRQE